MTAPALCGERGLVLRDTIDAAAMRADNLSASHSGLSSSQYPYTNRATTTFVNSHALPGYPRLMSTAGSISRPASIDDHDVSVRELSGGTISSPRAHARRPTARG